MNQSRIIQNYQIVSILQNPDPGDAKQEINLLSPDISVPS